MFYMYVAIGLIFSFVNAEVLASNCLSDWMSDESPAEEFSLFGNGSSEIGTTCVCEQCIQYDRAMDNDNGLLFDNGYSNDSPKKIVRPQLDLYSIAQKILEEVLQFDLKTTNSVAADRIDRKHLFVMRKNSPISDWLGTSNEFHYCLDEAYNRAKLSIEHGVANCCEYSLIGVFLAMEKIFLSHEKIMVKFARGSNFDHQYIAIGRLNDGPDKWVAIDPWLRKVFPFIETPKHLEIAGIGFDEGDNYLYETVTLFDCDYKYDPERYNLRTIKKLLEYKPRIIKLALDSRKYNVPYESGQKYYDPETKVMTIGSKIRVRIKKKNLN